MKLPELSENLETVHTPGILMSSNTTSIRSLAARSRAAAPSAAVKVLNFSYESSLSSELLMLSSSSTIRTRLLISMLPPVSTPPQRRSRAVTMNDSIPKLSTSASSKTIPAGKSAIRSGSNGRLRCLPARQSPARRLAMNASSSRAIGRISSKPFADSRIRRWNMATLTADPPVMSIVEFRGKPGKG